MTNGFTLGQSVKVAGEGCTRSGEVGVIVRLPRRVRLYRVRFADGFECSYFHTHLAGC